MSGEVDGVGGVLPRIHRLDVQLANQIAAGEVVERPAAVLKELLENALDAGASRIEVDLEGAGSRLIRVRDNGHGIHRDDLALALARHGTSKIRRFEDLDSLHSLGFRGEALASIASVSRFKLRSRLAGADRGWEIATPRFDHVAADETLGSEPGELGGELRPTPAAMSPGTEVEVRDLFFNTPARRRFLRAERTELHHLVNVLERAALVAFDAGIVARHGQRRLLSVVPASDAPGRLRRVGQVLGRAFATSAVCVDDSAGEMRLSGWVLPPHATATTSPGQHVFLNQRPIRDSVVRHALGLAHDEVLQPGQQPTYVLYLTVPPRLVDVNVHPAKTEVRFRDARSVHDFLLASVRRALLTGPDPSEEDSMSGISSAPPHPEADLGGGGAPEVPPANSGGGDGLRADFTPGPRGRASAGRYDVPVRREQAGAGAIGELNRFYRGSTHAGSTHAGSTHRGPVSRASTAARPSSGSARGRDDGVDLGLARAFGIVVGRYWIVPAGARAVLLDVPELLAAGCRHRLKTGIAAGAVISRPLLVPYTETRPAHDVARVMDSAQALEGCGVVIRSPAQDMLVVRQLPAMLAPAMANDVLGAVLEWAGREGEELVEVLAGVARRHASGEFARGEALEAWRRLHADAVEPVAPWGWPLDEVALARLMDG